MLGLKSLRWQLVLIGTLLMSASVDAAVTAFLGKSADQWAQRLTSNDKKQRRTAAFALGKLGATAANYLGELARLVQNDPEANVRDTAAFAIGEICRDLREAGLGIPQAATVRAALVAKLTSDGSDLVRRSCAFALGCMGPEAANSLAALDQATGDTSAAVRQNVAWALGQIGSAGVTSLEKLLKKETDPYVIRDCAVAVQTIYENGSKSGDETQIEKLKGELTRLLPLLARAYNAGRSAGKDRGARDEMRKAVLAALVPIVDNQNGAAALGALQRALTDPLYSCRRNAALALANIGGTSAQQAIPILQHMLQNDDLDFRIQAAAALHNVGSAAASAVPLLRQTLAEQPPGGADGETRKKYVQLRRMSALALAGIGRAATKAVPDLVERAADENEDPSVRLGALTALLDIGACQETWNAVGSLIAIARNRKNPPYVRAYVYRALSVHKEALAKVKELYEVSEDILEEVKNPTNVGAKLLRYNAAQFLAVFAGPNASDAVIQTIQDGLDDEQLAIYAGTSAKAAGGSDEKTKKGAEAAEKGRGDGRQIFITMLEYIGAERIRKCPEIIRRLKSLAQNAQDPVFREACRKLIEDFRLQ